MKRVVLFLISLLILLAGSPGIFAQGTTFTYQGVLRDTNGPLNTNLAITFSIYAGASTPLPLWQEAHASVPLRDGLFSVVLGRRTPVNEAVFNGGTRWLGITVEDSAELQPRAQITPTPYAIAAGTVRGPIPSDGLSGIYSGAVTFTNTQNRFSGNGSGLFSLNANVITLGTLPDARLSANVALRNAANTFTGNQAVVSGNLGVGTAFPSARLHVAGQLRITGGSPGDGKLLVSDASGLASWRTPSELLSVFYWHDFSVRVPDAIDNTAEIYIVDVGEGDVVIVNGPGLEIQRIPGFQGTNANDQPGPNVEYPLVFECDGPLTNALASWRQRFTNNPATNRQPMSIVIRYLDGTEHGRWNLYEMGITRIEPGTDGRHRYTLEHGLPPNNRFGYERDMDVRNENSKNAVTDLYRIDILHVDTGDYPVTQIDYTNRTITLIFDYVEGGSVYDWADQIAQGFQFKPAMSVVTESLSGEEVSRRNFFGVFPISYQQTTGFGQVEKLKEKIVLSFDYWEDA